MSARTHNGIPCWGPDQSERERVGELVRYVEPEPADAGWGFTEEDSKVWTYLESLMRSANEVLRDINAASAEPAEDLRLPRVDARSGLTIEGVKVHGDLMPLDGFLWADERAGEVCFTLLPDVCLHAINDSGDIATCTCIGHVEIIGPTDEERRAHLARRRIPPD